MLRSATILNSSVCIPAIPAYAVGAVTTVDHHVRNIMDDKDGTSQSNSARAMPPPAPRASTSSAMGHSDTSAQMSITRAPWATGAPSQPSSGSEPSRTPSGASLNPESLQAQEKAPWVGGGVDGGSSGGGGAGAGGGNAPRPLPQAPTRAPWADGKIIFTACRMPSIWSNPSCRLGSGHMLCVSPFRCGIMLIPP